MTDKELYNELFETKRMIESKLFQTYIVGRMREYQEKLKDAYDCESLRELATIKGRKQGSEEFFKILKTIDHEFKNKKTDIENAD